MFATFFFLMLIIIWGKGMDIETDSPSCQTSFSLLVNIQPEPFIQELHYLHGSDGFHKRALLPAAKPTPYLSEVEKEASGHMAFCCIMHFRELFDQMYADHENRGIQDILDGHA